MRRKNRGKQTLKKKMLSILLLSAMSSILAVVIVSYMTIRMIQNDSIQESMQIYLEQITREIDSDYYDMIGIVNQMSPDGLIGSATERYLSSNDNYDRYLEQKFLREELIKLGYVNTKLLGITYYDPKEQKELIGNFNVRVLDPTYQTISKVVVGADNTIQAMHDSYLGIKETPVVSVMRRVSFGNQKMLDIYAEIEPDMSVSDQLNKEKWPYTYMEMDENGIVQYSNNPVIVRGQKILSELPKKEGYAVTNQEGYKIMVYRSTIGYANAIALPENIYQKEMNMWRLKLVVIILSAFGIFSCSVIYLYRLICKPLNQLQKQIIQVGNGALHGERQEYEIKEFDDLMHEVEQMKEQIRNLIDDVVEKEKNIQRTEYEKLLYQINPHFLYNALDTVNWMAMKKGDTEICDMVSAISNLMRISIGNKQDIFSIRQELKYVKDYLYIQETRYRDRFQVYFAIDEKILDEKIPKLTIQPLVENAIVHSVEVSKGKTVLNINGYIEQGNVVIEIKDDGVGMDRDTLLHLLDPPEGEEKDISVAHTGLGMYAVHQRLRYLYGEEYGLTADSEPGNGTCIKICIPFTKGEEKTWS